MFCIKTERLLGSCLKDTGDIERLSLAKDGDNWTSERIMTAMESCTPHYTTNTSYKNTSTSDIKNVKA